MLRFHGLIGASLLGLCCSPLAFTAPAPAIELRGQTFFATPPWKLRLITYSPYKDDVGPEYFFSIDVPQTAEVPLAALEIMQTGGFDRNLFYDSARTHAFLGVPRHGGSRVPVEVTIHEATQVVRIVFPEPVQPGATVTVVLMPYRNPSQADTYMFAVTAFPFGPNPVSNPVGMASLRIYEPSWR
ncbi:DUF2808 domain-containing protein [Cyanobium sp. Morenito 9A2]|uniref:DUF2808 domain-containing protein n=1 Tax=Cyanobium sp. Morenito 9A2 TaxID=2823718 RepID=UPI0020CC468A|nr:DUF2808 domain-containing protein [Cyanobium sp. Morenito 9A2]MCP9850810.1 DUF2808 domain-containing protein [Cyanobium sp. Morenito 9A2]